MSNENTNIINTTKSSENDVGSKKKDMPRYYGNMDEKLSLEDALEQYESLIFKDTISPRKSIKEYKNELNINSISEVSDIIFKSSLDVNNGELVVVGLLALSPNNVSHLPPTEKDGIIGLSILSNALSNLGLTVIILTDSINQPVISDVLNKESYFRNYVNINQEIGFPPKDFLIEKGKIYVVGVVPQPGIDSEWEEFLDDLCTKFKILISLGRPSRDTDTGIYKNSRGLRMNHYCSDLESIFINAIKENSIPTIALSDSCDNQLGIYSKNDKRKQHNARYVLLSHKNDWVCYFLTASIALRLSDRFKNSILNDKGGDSEGKVDTVNHTVTDINKKILLELYLSIFPNEEVFIYLNEKVKELQVWDTLFGEGLIKGFTLENDWEVRMKIRRVANQFGVSVDFNSV
ncbi:hypothetical protein FG386_002368 [Cryptosporidium ryanae]|uniref:uncharacterized protein n=1 Tax=Cryptosporidium ryanae TaxID=515981 RepID=UPI00351A9FC1|nr:hypothetical protein FG386_002368 [Cryptosporidium ryanae]